MTKLYVLSGIMIFCSTVLDAAIHLPSKGTSYSEWNDEITVVQEIHMSRLELQRWPLKFVISFSKVYIFGIGIEVRLIPFGIM
jgi:hypothetical protein